MSKSAPKLPRLPIPELQVTCDRYLKSIEPFLLEDAANGGMLYETAHERQVEMLHAFQTRFGRIAQHQLMGA
jgi:carnitine O-acetyltransferase